MIKVKRIEVEKNEGEFFSDAGNNKIPLGLGKFLSVCDLETYDRNQVYEVVLTHNFIRCFENNDGKGFFNSFKCSICNFTLGRSLFEGGPYSKLEPTTCKECIIKGLLE